MAKATNKIHLILANEFLYPLDDADLEVLRAVGYSGVRVAYRAFTALSETVFKRAGLDASNVTLYTFESAASLLLNRFFQALEKDMPSTKQLSIRDRDTSLLPENIIETLETGIAIAVRIREECLTAFETHLELLKRYFGRYQYAVRSSYTTSPGWRVYQLDIQHSEDLPFFIHYGLTAESQDVQYLRLNPYTRLALRRSVVLDKPALSVQVEDRTGDTWVQQAQARTFPITPDMASSAVQLATWLLGTFASSAE